MTRNSVDSVDIEKLLSSISLLERKEAVIDGIDEICDTNRDPSAMISSMTDFLSDFFNSELCVFCLDEDGSLVPRAIVDSAGIYQKHDVKLLKALEESSLESEDTAVTGLQDKIHILSSGIFMEKGKRLGAILLARRDAPYTELEREILTKAESRIDTGLVQCRDYHELEIRKTILEALNNFDNLRDKHLSLDETLSSAINLQLSYIPARIGIIALFDTAGNDLELKGTSPGNAAITGSRYEAIKSFCLEALENRNTLVKNNFDDDLIKSLIGIPLVLEEHKIGVLCCINSTREKGFSENDIRILDAIGSQMDTTIFESLQASKIKALLSRSVDPKVMKKLIDNPNAGLLEAERREVTMLYIDLRGSTKLARSTDPKLLVEFINEYFEIITKIVFDFEGTLNNFVGDEVVAFWNAPLDQPDHAFLAVRAAIRMQEVYSAFIKRWGPRGITNLAGIGIATGVLTVGEMGCPERTIYTVLGDVANVGARFCGRAPGGKILIDRATLDACRGFIQGELMHGLELKGLEGEDIEIFQVIE